jgi:ABC-2 type transport system permease protein
MTTASSTDLRRGLGYWVGSYRSMLRFEVTNLRVYLSIALVVQTLMGGGMALMYGFYLGELPPEGQLWLVTGIPALAVFPIGFVVVPNVIIQHKLADTYDFVWSLPVPRLASAASTFTVFTVLAFPGTLLALAIAWWRYDVDLALTWAFLPAVILTSLMATSVGFAVGHAIPDPRVTNLLLNVLVFSVLLFTPIVVPIDLFPGWLAGLHRGLPFYHMAEVLRASLSRGLVSGVAGSYLMLGLWTAASWTLGAWVVGRRK